MGELAALAAGASSGALPLEAHTLGAGSGGTAGAGEVVREDATVATGAGAGALEGEAHTAGSAGGGSDGGTAGIHVVAEAAAVTALAVALEEGVARALGTGSSGDIARATVVTEAAGVTTSAGAVVLEVVADTSGAGGKAAGSGDLAGGSVHVVAELAELTVALTSLVRKANSSGHLLELNLHLQHLSKHYQLTFLSRSNLWAALQLINPFRNHPTLAVRVSVRPGTPSFRPGRAALFSFFLFPELRAI